MKFEKDQKFLKKDITLTWLASYLGTNTKYLSETIKTHKNKNFSSYINGLRINYITQKLYEDPQYRQSKIISLAKECGYASAQVFVIAFKKENGFSPSFFINNLNENKT
ncbi:helix-turn-helix domain-containing protein [Chryseobacterium wanjuense]